MTNHVGRSLQLGPAVGRPRRAQADIPTRYASALAGGPTQDERRRLMAQEHRDGAAAVERLFVAEQVAAVSRSTLAQTRLVSGSTERRILEVDEGGPEAMRRGLWPGSTANALLTAGARDAVQQQAALRNAVVDGTGPKLLPGAAKRLRNEMQTREDDPTEARPYKRTSTLDYLSLSATLPHGPATAPVSVLPPLPMAPAYQRDDAPGPLRAPANGGIISSVPVRATETPDFVAATTRRAPSVKHPTDVQWRAAVTAPELSSTTVEQRRDASQKTNTAMHRHDGQASLVAPITASTTTTTARPSSLWLLGAASTHHHHQHLRPPAPSLGTATVDGPWSQRPAGGSGATTTTTRTNRAADATSIESSLHTVRPTDGRGQQHTTASTTASVPSFIGHGPPAAAVAGSGRDTRARARTRTTTTVEPFMALSGGPPPPSERPPLHAVAPHHPSRGAAAVTMSLLELTDDAHRGAFPPIAGPATHGLPTGAAMAMSTMTSEEGERGRASPLVRAAWPPPTPPLSLGASGRREEEMDHHLWRREVNETIRRSPMASHRLSTWNPEAPTVAPEHPSGHRPPSAAPTSSALGGGGHSAAHPAARAPTAWTTTTPGPTEAAGLAASVRGSTRHIPSAGTSLALPGHHHHHQRIPEARLVLLSSAAPGGIQNCIWVGAWSRKTEEEGCLFPPPSRRRRPPPPSGRQRTTFHLRLVAGPT